uniref:Eukaryotic translation initiation factor 3 subunit D n=1 Tax=Phlebotomus papatasi TaxID=29031 RepID=A0A1B0DHQ8_PHLPP
MSESENSTSAYAEFVKPQLQYNEDGWGPCEKIDFRDMPYQPFSKSDRLGKISDWTGTATVDKKFPNKYASQFGTGSQYAYYHDEDETTFHLVDTARVQKLPYQRGRFRGNMRNLRGRGGRGGGQGGLQSLGKSVKMRDQRRGTTGRKWGVRGPPPKIRDASVTVRPDWLTIEEMDFPRLAKLSLPGVKEGEDIMCCGTLEYYDKSYDRINVKSEKPLQRVDRIFHTVTTTDDPIIRSLSKSVGNVYATDSILATIMCCTRSNYSWDIVIDKIQDKLFMDKRDNTEFDLLTVNETSVEPPQDDGNSLNSPRNLAIEATFINHNFSQQVLKSGPTENKFKFPEPNPFIGDEEEGEVASALLGGSDQIKFGYVSRAHVKDSSRHVILGTQQFRPNEFATQINLSMDNAWGILRCIIDLLMKQKDGKYLIMKDPNKPMIRLYDIPENTFETDGSEESGDEGETFQPLYTYSGGDGNKKN